LAAGAGGRSRGWLKNLGAWSPEDNANSALDRETTHLPWLPKAWTGKPFSQKCNSKCVLAQNKSKEDMMCSVVQASNVLFQKKSPCKSTGTSLFSSATQNYSTNEQGYIINIINGLARQQ
jgi:hypothetical protein